MKRYDIIFKSKVKLDNIKINLKRFFLRKDYFLSNFIYINAIYASSSLNKNNESVIVNKFINTNDRIDVNSLIKNIIDNLNKKSITIKNDSLIVIYTEYDELDYIEYKNSLKSFNDN